VATADTKQGIADEGFISHGVRAIVSALRSGSIFEGVSNIALRVRVMGALIGSLLRFLKGTTVRRLLLCVIGD
jgi:hypothetical protein